jgi:hypothetical protein
MHRSEDRSGLRVTVKHPPSPVPEKFAIFAKFAKFAKFANLKFAADP